MYELQDTPKHCFRQQLLAHSVSKACVLNLNAMLVMGQLR
jgi:hypothetical protein